MILGFIGTGKITSSIICGLLNSKLKTKRIYISSRNKNIAKKLERKSRSIKILKNNQEIVNRSSILFLAVTPIVANKILPKLKFKKKKKKINLISTINLKKLKRITKSNYIIRAIPLPPVEINKGPIVICPPNNQAKRIFNHIGTVIEIKNENLSFKFWSTASLMAAYYEILNVSSNWLIKKGIKKNMANNYISELFLSLSIDAANKKKKGFKKLVEDSQTPKGLNMEVLKGLKKKKFYLKWINSLDQVNKRVSK